MSTNPAQLSPQPLTPPIANQTGHFPYTDGHCALSFGGYELGLNRFKSLCRDIFTFLLRVNPEVRQGRRAALNSTPGSAVPQSPRLPPQVTAVPLLAGEMAQLSAFLQKTGVWFLTSLSGAGGPGREARLPAGARAAKDSTPGSPGAAPHSKHSILQTANFKLPSPAPPERPCPLPIGRQSRQEKI